MEIRINIKDIPIFDISGIDNELYKLVLSNNGDYRKSLRQYLALNYKNTLLNIGNVYHAYFNRTSAREYSYPANHRLNSEILNIKCQLAIDLNGITSKAIYIKTNKESKQKRKFDEYDIFIIYFGIKNLENKIYYYSAVLNIGVNNNNQPIFYDITKIKKMPSHLIVGQQHLYDINITRNNSYVKINEKYTGDYLYDVVILDEKKGVPTPMANPSPELDTPKRNITLKENGVKPNVTTNKDNNKLCCKRCGNTDLSYFYKGSRGYYCRKCIGFKRTLIEEDIKVVNYDIKDEAYEYFFKYELTKYQRKASNEILKNIINGKDVLLEAVCGAGKTELVVETMSYFLNHHKKVCYSISRTEVVKELTSRFKSIFKNAKVVGVYGGHHTELTGDLIVCTTHQLFRYYKTFDLLIIDEVDAFPLSGNASLINISLNSCVGNVIFSTATSNSFLKDILTKRDYEKVSLKVRPSLKPLTIPIVKYCFPLIQLFNILLNSNERFIIFVSTKKEVLTIYYLLKYFKNCTYVYSDLKDRDKNIMDFKNNKYDIIVSTSVLERGITINRISVILYMKTNSIMDTSSIIQMIGRVGRGTKYTDGKAYILANSKYKEIDEVLSYLKEANDALSLL